MQSLYTTTAALFHTAPHLTCSLDDTDVALEKQELDGKEMPVGQEQSDEWPAVLEVANDDHRDNPIDKAYQRRHDDGQPHEGDWQARDKPVRFKTESTSESSHGPTVQTGHTQQHKLHPHLHSVPVLEQSDECQQSWKLRMMTPGTLLHTR